MAAKVGEIAPSIEARNQDGKMVRLADFKGKHVLLYFYPKDDTPGCTKQACALRDGYKKFEDKGIVILGVSAQDEESHRKFKKKYNLPFDLLVDDDGRIAEALGVERMPLIGLHKRQSVLIGKDGKVVAFLESVDPATHADEILAKIPDSN